ncbi:MAG: hypothetical protein F6K65_22040 [Moorea sp. SIO3C2]|nr:hypothetical protein [Moorena sp. SIO3C2]
MIYGRKPSGSSHNPQGFKWSRVQISRLFQWIAPGIWDYVRGMVVEYLWYCYGVEIGSTAESRLSSLIAKSVTSALSRELLAHAT